MVPKPYLGCIKLAQSYWGVKALIATAVGGSRFYYFAVKFFFSGRPDGLSHRLGTATASLDSIHDGR